MGGPGAERVQKGAGPWNTFSVLGDQGPGACLRLPHRQNSGKWPAAVCLSFHL